MEIKGTIKVKKDSKLGMYRHLMEKAMNFGMINIILNG